MLPTQTNHITRVIIGLVLLGLAAGAAAQSPPNVPRQVVVKLLYDPNLSPSPQVRISWQAPTTGVVDIYRLRRTVNDLGVPRNSNLGSVPGHILELYDTDPPLNKGMHYSITARFPPDSVIRDGFASSASLTISSQSKPRIDFLIREYTAKPNDIVTIENFAFLNPLTTLAPPTYEWLHVSGDINLVSDIGNNRRPTFQIPNDFNERGQSIFRLRIGSDRGDVFSKHITINIEPIVSTVKNLAYRIAHVNAGTLENPIPKPNVILTWDRPSPPGPEPPISYQILGGANLLTIDATTDASLSITDPNPKPGLGEREYIVSSIFNDRVVPETITVTITDNTKPIANAGNDTTIDELPERRITLIGSGSDAEDSSLTYFWTPPEGITLDNNTFARPSFVVPDVSVATPFIFTLRTYDNAEFSDPATVTITVTPGTTLTAPQNFTARYRLAPNAMLSDLQVVLDWDAPRSPTDAFRGYEITRADNGDTVTLIAQLSPNNPTLQTTHTDQNAPTAGTEYTYTVTAFTPSARQSATTTFTLNMPAIGVIASPDITITFGDTLTLTGDVTQTISGAAGEVRYIWEQIGENNDGLILDIPEETSAVQQIPVPVGDSVVPITLSLQLRAERMDGFALAAPTSVVILPFLSTAHNFNFGRDLRSTPTVTLRWQRPVYPNDPTAPITYRIERSIDTGSANFVSLSGLTIMDSTATMLSTIDQSGLAKGSAYIYRIIAERTDPMDNAARVTRRTTHRVSLDDPIPFAVVGPDQTVLEGSTVMLTGDGSRDDGGQLEGYMWSEVGTSLVTLSDATIYNPSFEAPNVSAETNLVFELVVTDNSNQISAPASVTINILPALISARNVRAEYIQTNRGTPQAPDIYRRIVITWERPAFPANPTIPIEYIISSRYGTHGMFLSTDATLTLTIDDPVYEGISYDYNIRTMLPDNGSVFANVVTNQVNPAPNTKPTAEAGPDQTVDELLIQTVSLRGAGTDPDPDTTLSFLWTAPAGITLSNSETINPSFAVPDVSVDTPFIITLRTYDGLELSDPDTVTITVTAGEQITPPRNLTARYRYPPGAAADAFEVELDWDPPLSATSNFVSYEITRLANGETITVANALSSGDPAAVTSYIDRDDALAPNTVYTYTVIADAGATNERTSVDFTLNTPSIARTMPDVTLNYGDILTLTGDVDQTLAGAAGAIRYTWTQLSDGSAGDGLLTIPPSTAATQLVAIPLRFTEPPITLSVQLRAERADGVSFSMPTRVTVLPVITAPHTFDFSQDISGSQPKITLRWQRPIHPLDTTAPITYRIERSIEGSGAFTASPSLTIHDSTAANLMGIDTNGLVVGRYTYRITAERNYPRESMSLFKASANHNFSLENSAPSAMPGRNQTVLERTRVTLDGSASSDADSGVTYQWLQVGGTSVTLMDGTNPATREFVAPPVTSDTNLEFELTVTDSLGESNSARVNITVDNINPVADAGENQDVDTGTIVTLDGSASTVDDNPPGFENLRYLWALSPSIDGLPSILIHPRLSFMAPPVAADTTETVIATLRVISVTPNNIETPNTERDIDRVTITVNPPRPPTAPRNFNANFGQDEHITLTWELPERVGLGFTGYRLQGGVGGAFTDIVPGLAGVLGANAITFIDTMIGTGGERRYRLFAVNATGQSPAAAVSISFNLKPIARSPTNNNIHNINDLVTLDATSSSDPEGGTLTYSWLLGAVNNSPPPELTGIDSATPSFRIPSVGLSMRDPNANAEGETFYNYLLTVTDPQGAQGVIFRTLRVNILTPPSPPQNLQVELRHITSAIGFGRQGAFLTWEPPALPGYLPGPYNVTRREMSEPTSSAKFLTTIRGLQHLDNDEDPLVPGMTYIYRVTSTNNVQPGTTSGLIGGNVEFTLAVPQPPTVEIAPVVLKDIDGDIVRNFADPNSANYPGMVYSGTTLTLDLSGSTDSLNRPLFYTTSAQIRDSRIFLERGPTSNGNIFTFILPEENIQTVVADARVFALKAGTEIREQASDTVFLDVMVVPRRVPDGQGFIGNITSNPEVISMDWTPPTFKGLGYQPELRIHRVRDDDVTVTFQNANSGLSITVTDSVTGTTDFASLARPGRSYTYFAEVRNGAGAGTSPVVTHRFEPRRGVTNAGADRTVAFGEIITLSGSDSRSNIMRYEWRVLSGNPDVEEFMNADRAISTLRTPSTRVPSHTVFEFCAIDSTGAAGCDDVSISYVLTRPRGVINFTVFETIAEGGNNYKRNVTLTWDRPLITGPGFNYYLSRATIVGNPIFEFMVDVDATSFVDTTTPAVVPDIQRSYSYTLTPRNNLDQGLPETRSIQLRQVPLARLRVIVTPPTGRTESNLAAEGTRVTLDARDSRGYSDRLALGFKWEQEFSRIVGGADVDDITLTFTNGNSIASFIAPDGLVEDLEMGFAVTVEGIAGLMSTARARVQIHANQNDPPIVDSGEDQTVMEDVTVTLDATRTTDPEDDSLGYQWTQIDSAGVVINNSDEALATFIAPNVLVQESYIFAVTVTDERIDLEGNNPDPVMSTPVTITVTGDSDPPVVGVDPNLTVMEDATVTLGGEFIFDPEGLPMTFVWEQTLPDAPGLGYQTGITKADIARPIFFAPVELVSPVTMQFRVTVTDPQMLTATGLQTVTVLPGPNAAPEVMRAPDQTVPEGSDVVLVGNAEDAEMEELNYLWAQVSPTSGLGLIANFDGGTNERDLRFTAPDQLVDDLTLIFSFVVSDARGEAADALNTQVIVEAGVNDAPVIDAAPLTSTTENQPVTLTASATDAEGEDISFAWVQTEPAQMDKFGGVPLTDDNTSTLSFTAPTELVDDVRLRFRVIATDARGAASEPVFFDVDVTAGDNDAPSAVAFASVNDVTQTTVAEGATVRLDGRMSSDPEGEALTFVWTQTAPIAGKGAGVSLIPVANNNAHQRFIAPTQLVNDVEMVFNLVVTDARGLPSPPVDVAVTVTAGPNDAPTALPGDNQIVIEGQRVTLSGGGIDPEEQGLTYTWQQIEPASGEYANISLTATNTAQINFDAPDQLIADVDLVFALTVQDERLLDSQPANITVTTVVAGGNVVPVARAGNPQAVNEDATVTLDGSQSSDAESQPLTYMWTQTAGAPTVTLTDRTIAIPTFVAPQLVADVTLTFSLVVNDGANDSAASTVRITIAADNDLPTATVNANFAVAEGAPVTLTGGGSDPEGLSLTYQWEQLGGTTVVLDEATPHRPTFTAPNQLAEDVSLIFALTTNDGVQDSARREVTVTVTAGANGAPTAMAGANQTVAEGVEVRLDGSTSSDPEGASLTFAWQQTGGDVTVTLSSTTTAQPTFPAPRELVSTEMLVFSLTVTDPVGASSVQPALVTITVTAGANDIPIAHPGDEQTANENTTVTLSGAQSSDPEGETLSFAWVQTAPTSGLGASLTLTNPNTVMPTFVTPVQLVSNVTLTFRLTVTDARGAVSVPLSINVVTAVGENDRPSVTVNPRIQNVDEGDMVTISGGGSDPEGQAITYSWRQLDVPPVTLINANSARMSFMAPNNLLEPIDLVFELTVTDSGFTPPLTQTATATVNIRADNEPPTANAGTSRRADEGERVTLNGSGMDSEEQALRFFWEQIAPASGQYANLSLTSRSAQAPEFTAPAQLVSQVNLEFRLVVSDGVHDSAPALVTITINPGNNDSPIARVGGPQTVAEGALVNLTGVDSSDPEGQNLTYRWTQVVGDPTNLSDANSAQPVFFAPTQLINNALYVFHLTVTDTGGASSVQPGMVSITITAGANDRPTAVPTVVGGSRNQRENVLVTLSGEDSTDPEGETLSFAWTQTAPTSGTGSNLALTNQNTAMPSFRTPLEVQGDVGLTFQLIVTDARGLASAARTITVTVLQLGRIEVPPRADAGDRQSVNENVTVLLDGTGSISNTPGSSLTYSWQQIGTPAVTLRTPTAATTTFVSPQNLTTDEELVFSLTVTESATGLSATDTTTVRVVTENSPPIAEAGDDQTVGEGARVTLDASGSDDQEDSPLLYSWRQSGGPDMNLALANDVRTSFVAPVQLAAPMYLVFTVEVTDIGRATTTDEVAVTVMPGPNDAPTANAGADQVVLNETGVTLRGSGFDAEGEALDFLWRQVSGMDVPLSNTNLPTPTFDAPTVDRAITLIFALQVTDARGEQSRDILGVGEDVNSDYQVKVTVVNSPMLDDPDTELAIVVLPEVVRALTDSIFTAINRRVDETIEDTGARIGGKSTVASALQAYGTEMGNGELDWRTLLRDTEFNIRLDGTVDDWLDEALGGEDEGWLGAKDPLVFWGGGAYRELTGNNQVSWDGALTSAHFGFDRRLSRELLIGVAGSYQKADLTYKALSGEGAPREIAPGTYTLDTLGLYPYLGWREPDVDLWATAGFDSGSVAITAEKHGSRSGDISMRSLGIGGSGRVWPWWQTVMRLKGEAYTNSLTTSGFAALPPNDATQTEEVAATDAHTINTNRIRFTLEAHFPAREFLNGGEMHPSAEIGVRTDGGAGLTGHSAELGGGFLYFNPATRLSAEGRVRTLFGHSKDFGEWGISGKLSIEPQADGQGISVSITPKYGETDGGVETVWSADPRELTDIATQNNYALRLQTKLSYGMRLPNVRGLVTPYTELTIGDADIYRMGINWKAAERIDFNLLGERSGESVIRVEGEIGF